MALLLLLVGAVPALAQVTPPVAVRAAQIDGEQNAEEKFLIKAQSVREAIRQARGQSSFSETMIDGQAARILFVFEGKDQESVVVRRDPREERVGVTIDLGAGEFEIRQIPIVREIEVTTNSSDARQALRGGLERIDLVDDFKPSQALHSIRDKEIDEDESWPLNWKLGEEAGVPLTYDDAVQLLKAKYHWEDLSEYMPDPRMLALCDCGDALVWDGDHEDKTARDLLFAVLSQAHKTRTDRSGRNTSYQVNPLGKGQDGIMTWEVLGF